METVTKTEYKIRDLGTQSVTLFPTKAQISRQIKDVALKPGANEITIAGLSPTVDEHSIKVEGTGSAIITDIAVESLPNRENYDDVYPSSDDESEEELASDGDEDDNKEPEKSPEMKDMDEAIRNRKADFDHAHEEVNNASTRRSLLETWSYNLRDNDHEKVDIKESLEVYKDQRRRFYEQEVHARKYLAETEKDYNDTQDERRRLEKRENKANAAARKERRRADKARAKERERSARLALERREERKRVRKEREHFWPKYVYSVRISLDATAYTPMSSRRGSVASDLDMARAPASPPPKPSDGDEAAAPSCDLLLSYVTTSAYWSPSYDLQLSTTSATGTLCFDAQLRNSTSETWDNCRVTLSTTQSTYSGLEDTIPALQPWHIKLARPARGYEGDVASSAEERAQRDRFLQQQRLVTLPKPRGDMFGAPDRRTAADRLAADDYQAQLRLLEDQNKRRLMMARQEQDGPPPPQQMQMQTMAAPQAFGSQATAAQQQAQQQVQAMAQAQQRGMGQGGAMRHRKITREGGNGTGKKKKAFGSNDRMGHYDTDDGEDEEVELHDRGERMDSLTARGADTLVPEADQALEYQESQVEETGLTTTYDLPGLKTLAPRSSETKQRVARIHFPAVTLSHIVVAKYRPAAYLKAKLRNGSKLTLLRGPAGLTLDGSFMGRTTLPRVSAGDTFGLSLGVDPAIKAVYSKPDVRRSTTGMFSKENSSMYVRTLTLQNTRASAGKPVALQVLDQVPVSEDERLSVQILSPYNMVVGGEGVKTGRPGRDGSEDRDWGAAKASLRKGGEISWNVSLNAGKVVKLVLEYQVACPSGDAVVEC